VTDCTVSDNTGVGISAGDHSTVARCVAERSGTSGILVGADSVVENNRCNGNGASPNHTAPGIALVGDRNRASGNSTIANDKGITAQGRGNLIEDNHVRGNTGPGIEVTTANGKNIVVRNRAGDNGGSYTAIAAGNNVAPVVAAENATNPFSNILN
jgi:parallel beta-helix repeat protein